MIAHRFHVPAYGRFACSVALAAVLFGAGACQTPASVEPQRGTVIHVTGEDTVRARAPIDVAILPIANLTSGKVPTDELRQAFQRGLVARKYSPLAFEYVDQRIVDAAYNPGSAEEQGVLSIEVQRWDTRLWETHSAVECTLRVRLLDATSGGSELWTATADRRFDFGSEFERLPTQTARVRFAVDRIAAEMLERLPARRTPVAGG